jgi:hypothetical protein
MDLTAPAFAGALGIFAFFGGIALLVWVSQKGEAEKKKLEHERELQKRQLEHAERLKALEVGQPLPDADVARAQADQSRFRAAGLVAVLVPLAMAGAAIGSTPIILNHSWEGSFQGVLYAVWGVCGLVSLVTVTNCISVLNRRDKKPADVDRSARSSDRFQDKPPSPIKPI